MIACVRIAEIAICRWKFRAVRRFYMKRKARKRFRKQVRKLLRAQGPDVLIGLITGIVTNLITDHMAGGKWQDKSRSKGSLAQSSLR
jgi:hypothetical protein